MKRSLLTTIQNVDSINSTIVCVNFEEKKAQMFLKQRWFDFKVTPSLAKEYGMTTYAISYQCSLLGFCLLNLCHYLSIINLSLNWVLSDGAVSLEKTESNDKSLVWAAGRRQERLSLFIKMYDHRLHSYGGNSTFITFHSGKFLWYCRNVFSCKLQPRIFFNKTFTMDVSEGISSTCFVFCIFTDRILAGR